MTPIRLRVSDLETLRYHHLLEDRTLDDLLRQLARVEPPNRKMDAGKALAKFFEHAREGVQDAAVVDGWRFNFNLAPDAPPFPLTTYRELKHEKVYETPSGPVVLVGVVDGLDGLTVRDQKLTDNPDIEDKYLDSLQWRAYLDMFGARRFVYDLFVGRVPDHDDEVKITAYHPVTFYSYPGMAADVTRAVCELAEIVSRYESQIAALKGAA